MYSLPKSQKTHSTRHAAPSSSHLSPTSRTLSRSKRSRQYSIQCPLGNQQANRWRTLAFSLELP